jgi:hypothetical protein
MFKLGVKLYTSQLERGSSNFVYIFPHKFSLNMYMSRGNRLAKVTIKLSEDPLEDLRTNQFFRSFFPFNLVLDEMYTGFYE